MDLLMNDKRLTVVKVMQNLFVVTLLLIVVTACSSDDDNDSQTTIFTNGSMQELRAFYNDGFVDALVNLGFTFNLGNTPPNIEGTYIIDPFILDSTTDPSRMGHEGEDFGSHIPSFSNQNNNELTIDYLGQSGGGGQTDIGKGSFIMGSNGAFSVFTKNNTKIGNITAITAVVISGFIASNGIEDIQFVGAMLDNKGNQILIDNNTGSLYVDGDGFATKQ
tara:strand:- start:516731 stop:517390 length:660 start_codon:yes stop_codon:yes gene_type:complete